MQPSIDPRSRDTLHEGASRMAPEAEAPDGDHAPIVLIVDDSLTIRMDLAAAFEAAGFVARLCGTAAEARAAWIEPVSVVILDIQLPDGDGVDLVEEIRANPTTAELPILMLSSEAEVEDRIRGMRTGADDYVGKPYDTHHVVARARELIGDREGAVQHRPTVLIVDDSPTFRDELRRALERGGYAVLTAASGEDGLRLAAMHRPTALIVDGELPGIDGPTVIRRIRLDVALRSTPCLLLTGSDARGAELQALDAGADAFSRKDGDLDVVLARLSVVLRRASTTRDEVMPLLNPKRILAVDDSETYLQTIAEALRGDGYDVVVARSGEVALEMLTAQPVDCVLLDLMMPGMGGMETCRRIKSSVLLREVPLIMVTATDNRQAMMDGLAAGADDYIVKSDELELLKARVHAQIRRKQLDDESHRRREEVLCGELDAAAADAARKEAHAIAALANELERRNQELEAFAYSVSHDLKSPLRSIDAFSQALLEDEGDALSDAGRGQLQHVRASARRMGQLIEDLMLLSRIGRTELVREPVCISDLARTVAAELARGAPERCVELGVRDGLMVDADGGLVRVLLDNLLGNAWKFTTKRTAARIEFGVTEHEGERAFFVQDNGAGFDPTHAGKLFTAFTRLHSEAEFAGTGIGLATVHRIVERHGGRAWAEGAVGAGATIFFTLAAASSRHA
ncbi:MAG TPA: response regulator [Kofleriaceae bacterium]|nr:response regulator [Kofleriaceae bacterium]